MEASFHSLKSEQSFRKQREARESVPPDAYESIVRGGERARYGGKFDPIVNQPPALLDPMVLRLSTTEP